MNEETLLGIELRERINSCVLLPFDLTEGMHMGHLLRGVREKAGLNQCDVSERGNVSRQEISNVELGHAFPSRKLCFAYVTACNLQGITRDHFIIACNQTPDDIFSILKRFPQLCDILRSELTLHG